MEILKLEYFDKGNIIKDYFSSMAEVEFYIKNYKIKTYAIYDEKERLLALK